MPCKNDLSELYAEHDGHVSDKWTSYLNLYQRLFSPFQETPVNLLEIGVQNGGSLQLWGKYFSQAEAIIGCDINPACAKLDQADGRIRVITGDINHPRTLDQIRASASSFDIIIDDGSHTSPDIIHTFCLLFPLLKQNGIFIAEDLHCCYWSKWQGGLYQPRSAMAFFKALADVLNFEHWGLEGHSRIQLLRPFGITPELTEDLLAQIHSVEFVNSMCIITRRPAEQNCLGQRRVAGTLELVAPVKHVDGTFSQAPPQKLLPNEGIPNLALQLESLGQQVQAKLARQQQQIDEQAQRIIELERIREQMGEHLLRADAQLELLKELFQGNEPLDPP